MVININIVGRIVARVFHGLSSPNFPSHEWYNKNKNRSGNSKWNKFPFVNFQELMRLADKVLANKQLKKQ